MDIKLFVCIAVSNILDASLSNDLPYTQTIDSTVSIPDELHLLDKLVRVDLRDNFITGPLPSSLGKLMYLRDLNLYENQINGTIPLELFWNDDNDFHRGLENITIARNFITGTLSTYIGELKQLRIFYAGYNAISGTIPSELGLLSKISKFFTLSIIVLVNKKYSTVA